MMTGGFARRTPRADFLQQPFSPQDLLRRVRIQLALIQTRHELYEENLRIHRELDSHLRSKLAIDCLSNELSVGEYPEHIAGTSFAAARLREQIECAARTNGPLLIVGEVGTGREMAARAIHNRSDRRERPFIKLNCAALARDLLQQELNGVDRAGLRQLCGRMELVQGGTPLLAEVGELPLVYQEKLVRLLRAQHGELGVPEPSDGSMHACSQRRIVIFRRWSRRARFARIYGLDSEIAAYMCPHCGNGRRTFQSCSPCSLRVRPRKRASGCL